MFVSNGFNFAVPSTTTTTTALTARQQQTTTTAIAPILTPALDQFLNRRNGDASAAQNVIEELERNSVIRCDDIVIGDSIGEGYLYFFRFVLFCLLSIFFTMLY